jgi:hypothetical protein
MHIQNIIKISPQKDEFGHNKYCVNRKGRKQLVTSIIEALRSHKHCSVWTELVTKIDILWCIGYFSHYLSFCRSYTDLRMLLYEDFSMLIYTLL